jgi:death-on-curing protein
MFHKELINEHGGDDGIRDEALLDSALASPFQTFDEQSLFPSLQQKAVRIGFGLIANHPFVDGNKRIGAHVMLVLLAINGIELDYTQKELYEIIIDVAAGKASYEDLLQWVLNHED